MLKTIKLFKVLGQKIFRADDNKIIRGVGGGRVNKTGKNLFKSKKLKNTKFEILTYTNIEATKKLMFLTSSIKKAYNHLKQAFIKAPIFNYFDLD